MKSKKIWITIIAAIVTSVLLTLVISKVTDTKKEQQLLAQQKEQLVQQQKEIQLQTEKQKQEELDKQAKQAREQRDQDRTDLEVIKSMAMIIRGTAGDLGGINLDNKESGIQKLTQLNNEYKQQIARFNNINFSKRTYILNMQNKQIEACDTMSKLLDSLINQYNNNDLDSFSKTVIDIFDLRKSSDKMIDDVIGYEKLL